MRVRAGAPAEPLLVAPVAEVVPAALPGARPVRDLVVAVAHGGREIALPLGDGLAGPAEDEVDAHVQRGVANGGDGGGAVLRLVGPAERAEAASERALGADRDPRHAKRAPCLEARAIERRRVRLHGGLARPKVEGAAQGRGERRDLGRLEEARRPAAEVQRAHPRTAERLALARDLLSESGEVATAESGRRRRRREVAIRTA